jgi:hypothetical protein
VSDDAYSVMRAEVGQRAGFDGPPMAEAADPLIHHPFVLPGREYAPAPVVAPAPPPTEQALRERLAETIEVRRGAAAVLVEAMAALTGHSVTSMI